MTFLQYLKHLKMWFKMFPRWNEYSHAYNGLMGERGICMDCGKVDPEDPDTPEEMEEVVKEIKKSLEKYE
jgi:hypothetical protein